METIASHMQQPVDGGEVALELSEDEQAYAKDEETRKEADRLAKLDVLGQSLARTRAEAINARQASGIEADWIEDEEFYQGIDDANRAENRSTWRTKPPGQAAQEVATTTRSTVFPNITGPYVDAAAARISDMLLPTDDRSWGLKPTPVPEAIDAAKGKYSKPMLDEAAQMYPGQPELAKKRLAVATQAALEVIADAKAKADKAQTRIEDWHVECQWHAHVRLVIEDTARVGTGVLKGPIPIKKRCMAWKNNALVMLEEIKPGSKWIDYWNFYPAADCGENIHDGSYTWERDHVTKKQLRDLKGQPGYIDAQIDACLEEGATRAIAEFKPSAEMVVSDQNQKDRFEIWYFHGTAERVDLEAAGCDCSDAKDVSIPAMIVMVNNRVIKATLNPLDTGEFPYDVMVWRKRSGFWAGIGVARQIRTPQRIVTAATRNLMDNAGIAAGPMLVFRQGVVTPSDGKLAIAPRKIWYIAQDADEMTDATKAIGQIKVDMLVDDLLKIINLGLKLAEEVTGLPMLLQGQMGKAPDTLGGLQLLHNNASTVLRRLAKLFDDRVTEPHVRRYYTWLLMYGEDDEKGDYAIDARGSSALVERDLQNQAVMQMGSIVLDPRFGIDPKKWATEYLKSQRLDPSRFEYDDENWKEIVANMQKGASDPRVEIAKFRAETEAKLRQMDQAFQASEKDKDRNLELVLAQVEERVASMKMQGAREINFDDLKGMLADTVIKVRTQKELSAGEQHATRQVSQPPTEPAGRAAPGTAYQH